MDVRAQFSEYAQRQQFPNRQADVRTPVAKLAKQPRVPAQTAEVPANYLQMECDVVDCIKPRAMRAIVGSVDQESQRPAPAAIEELDFAVLRRPLLPPTRVVPPVRKRFGHAEDAVAAVALKWKKPAVAVVVHKRARELPD